AFMLEDLTTGELIEVPYNEYLAGISDKYSKDKYKVKGQVTSKPEVEPTKISDFSFMDQEGNDISSDFLTEPGKKILLVGHKVPYTTKMTEVIVFDTLYSVDTVFVEQGDSTSYELVKKIEDVQERTEEKTEYIFKPSFLEKWREAAVTAKNLSDQGVETLALLGGVGSEAIEAFAKQIGATFSIYDADDILLKTIVRSNPGYVAWDGGEIIGKWHYRKVSDEKLQEAFQTK